MPGDRAPIRARRPDVVRADPGAGPVTSRAGLPPTVCRLTVVVTVRASYVPRSPAHLGPTGRTLYAQTRMRAQA